MCREGCGTVDGERGTEFQLLGYYQGSLWLIEAVLVTKNNTSHKEPSSSIYHLFLGIDQLNEYASIHAHP
jgi:hypothetical protein